MASLIVAAGVALLWCWVALWVGPRVGYVDRPDGSQLKVHDRPAVPLGGVGVYLGFHVGAAFGGRLDPVLLAATTIVLILGLADDRVGLSPKLRLAVEVVASVVLVIGLHATTPWMAPVVAGALVVVAINAVNLFDGLDGLASSVGLVAALGVAGLTVSRGGDPGDALALAAALGGFLVLGWHPAKVFLGDAGAYLLGTLLAGLVIRGSPGGIDDMLIGACLLGVFALDLLVAILRRLRGRRPLFEGDRSHLYDQLGDRGLSVPAVVGVAVAAQTVLVLVVITVDVWWPGVAGVLILAIVAAAVLGALAAAGFLRVESAID